LFVLLLIPAFDAPAPSDGGSVSLAKAEIIHPYNLDDMTVAEALRLNGQRVRFRVVIHDDVKMVWQCRAEPMILQWRHGGFRLFLILRESQKLSRVFTVEATADVEQSRALGDFMVMLKDSVQVPDR
jgi:hypothetical protein